MDPISNDPNMTEAVDPQGATQQIRVKSVGRIRTPVAYLILGATLLFFWLGGGAEGESIGAWTLIPDQINTEGEYWRLLTAHFIHVGWLSFIISAFIDFYLCKQVESVFGSRATIFITLVVLLTNSAASVLLFEGGEINGIAYIGQSYGFRGLFLGYMGTMLGFLYAERGNPIAFLKDSNVLNYFFLLGLFLALDLTRTGFEPGGWLALVGGSLSGWGLRRWARGAKRSGMAMTLVVGLSVLFGLFSALAPDQALKISSSFLKTPQSEAVILLDQNFNEGEEKYYEGLAKDLGQEDKDCLKRGIFWLRAGHEVKALQDIHRFVKISGSAFSYAVLGRAYLLTRNSLDAREAFEEAARRDEKAEFPEVFYWLALSTYQPKARQDYFRKFLEQAEKKKDLYKDMIKKAREELP
jgi:membrane associated rhomboid family serine protease